MRRAILGYYLITTHYMARTQWEVNKISVVSNGKGILKDIEFTVSVVIF